MKWFLLCVLALTMGVLLALASGCAKEDPAPPPVPTMPTDLSTWSVPELVQPPPPPVPLPTVPKDKPTTAEKLLDYAPGEIYALTVPLGAPLDIVLGPDESVRNIIGGDRKPVEQQQTSAWEIREGAHGTGDNARRHVFVTASAPGLTMGMILTSTIRTYYLTLKSVGKSPVRVVRWRYPVEGDTTPVKPKEPPLLPDPEEPRRWHVGYAITSGTPQPPEWTPKAYDDGRKMFLVLPEVTLFETAPMVRMVGPNGPALVNARNYLNVIIVDQLAPRLELRVGLGPTAEVVQIARDALRTIQCPGDPECPVWPAAAQVLARKSPPVQPPLPVAPQTPVPPPGPAQPAPRSVLPQVGEVSPPDAPLPMVQGVTP